MSISFADFLDVLYGDDAAAYTTVSVKLTDGRFVCQTFNLSQRAEIAAHIQKHINYDIYIKRASQYVKTGSRLCRAAPRSPTTSA
jgi:hypothetical protein